MDLRNDLRISAFFGARDYTSVVAVNFPVFLTQAKSGSREMPMQGAFLSLLEDFAPNES